MNLSPKESTNLYFIIILFITEYYGVVNQSLIHYANFTFREYAKMNTFIEFLLVSQASTLKQTSLSIGTTLYEKPETKTILIS